MKRFDNKTFYIALMHSIPKNVDACDEPIKCVWCLCFVDMIGFPMFHIGSLAYWNLECEL